MTRPAATAFAAVLLGALLAPAAPATAKKKPPAAIVLPAPPVVSLAAALPLIDAAIAENRLDDARSLLARTTASNDTPGSAAELRLRSAEIALAEAGLAAAATGFTELTADPQVGARASQGLGIVRLRQNRLPDAIAALDAALAADPGLLRATLARGVAADRTGDWPRADAAWARALELAPQSAIARNNRGWSLLLRARHGDAEADFAAAVTLDPKLGAARTNLIFTRALQGKYREAFALSDKTTLAGDLNTVGFGAMARGDKEVAQTYFERAMQKNPRFDRTAWANLQYLFAATRSAGDALAASADDDPTRPALPRRP
ncbi:hypothetical protein IP88_06240 [alpha proteobacterium AAP81b]|nr:hypothetical protein IP88_06240 [alpha proteobacterium AAP81b]